MANYTFQMVAHIVVIFAMELLKVMVDFFIQMVIYIWANGKMIKRMVEELIIQLMEENMRDSGD